MGPNTTVLATKAYSRRADLPSFFTKEKDANILRAHLIYREGYVFKTDNNEDYVPNTTTPKFSHFVAVPLTVLPQYEANECIDESTYTVLTIMIHSGIVITRLPYGSFHNDCMRFSAKWENGNNHL
jgi:hypothetical protein